jgi:phosphoribosylformylglycinamidine synthase
LNFSTAFSSNAVSICNSVGLHKVKRLEVSTRYLIRWEQDGLAISPGLEEDVCKYTNCTLVTTEMSKPLLAKECHSFRI